MVNRRTIAQKDYILHTYILIIIKYFIIKNNHQGFKIVNFFLSSQSQYFCFGMLLCFLINPHDLHDSHIGNRKFHKEKAVFYDLYGTN